eukprot:2741334-Rhodomonas_salina.1
MFHNPLPLLRVIVVVILVVMFVVIHRQNKIANHQSSCCPAKPRKTQELPFSRSPSPKRLRSKYGVISITISNYQGTSQFFSKVY